MKILSKVMTLVAVMSLLVLSSCKENEQQIKVGASHVIWLGLDGWGSYCFEDSVNCEMPNIKALMEEGSWTLNSRTVLPSISAPNWKSMMSGTFPGMHGYNDNTLDPGFTPVYGEGEHRYPTVFHAVRQAMPSAEIGVQTEWRDVLFFCDSLCCDYKRYIAEADVPNVATAQEAAKYIKEKKPNLLFVQIDQIDHAGHSDGHRSEGYFAMVKDVDAQVGQIVQAVKDAGIYDDAVIVIVGDHGGVGYGHGGTHPDEITVPLVVSGKGIKKNHKIEEVVSVIDYAGIVADALGVEHPQCWRSKSLNIFE